MTNSNSNSNKESVLDVIHNYAVKRVVFNNDINNTKFINHNVNHIYVINLEKDRLRRNYIIRLMEKYNINFELIIVPKLTQEEYEKIGNKSINLGEAGCYLSHMYCLHDAIVNNYKRIIIFEDDIILHKKFHTLFEESMNREINYDIFFLGASDFEFHRYNHLNVDKEKNIYIPNKKSKFICGTFAILYSDNGMKEMFYNRLEKPTFMDCNLIEFLDNFEHSFYISCPNLAIADLSCTNIDHNFWLFNENKYKYYYKKCYDDKLNFNDYNVIYLALFDNFTLNTKVTYEENITLSIKCLFKMDNKKFNIIYSALVFDFFDFFDLEFIINN
jgi:GR25 family glycosyltransferase involved in LPS biosynthesis